MWHEILHDFTFLIKHLYISKTTPTLNSIYITSYVSVSSSIFESQKEIKGN